MTKVPTRKEGPDQKADEKREHEAAALGDGRADVAAYRRHRHVDAYRKEADADDEQDGAEYEREKRARWNGDENEADGEDYRDDRQSRLQRLRELRGQNSVIQSQFLQHNAILRSLRQIITFRPNASLSFLFRIK